MEARARIKCIGQGVAHTARKGFYLTHLFKEETTDFIPAIIIANENGFRISETLEHKADEEVYPKGGYKVYYCVRCGKKEMGWVPYIDLPLPVITKEGEVRYDDMEKEETA